jgi:hypothetical protein
VGIASDQHQDTAAVGLARINVDPVGPEICHLIVAPLALAECAVILRPD